MRQTFPVEDFIGLIVVRYCIRHTLEWTSLPLLPLLLSDLIPPPIPLSPREVNQGEWGTMPSSSGHPITISALPRGFPQETVYFGAFGGRSVERRSHPKDV